MSCKEMIKEYIFYSQKPFSSDQIVNSLGICYGTVKKSLQKFVKEGYVKKIGVYKKKNVYIYRKPTFNSLESIQKAYRKQLLKQQKQTAVSPEKTELEIIEAKINISLQRALSQCLNDITKDQTNQELQKLVRLLKHLQQLFKYENKKEDRCQI